MNEQRKIQTIAPFLADDFVELEEPIFDLDKYTIFLNQNSERLGTYKKYLTCKLHDSWVIDIKQQSNEKLEIQLNDFSTYVFADTLIEKYKLQIDSDNISFPLTIEFSGDLAVEYNSVDENGNLQSIEPISLDNYLYEQVTKLDDERIEIAFQFWKSKLKERQGEKIIVIVSAKNLTIIENQDNAWTESFGHEYDEIYEYYKQQFHSDRYVSDHNECETLIDEIENKMKTKKHYP